MNRLPLAFTERCAGLHSQFQSSLTHQPPFPVNVFATLGGEGVEKILKVAVAAIAPVKLATNPGQKASRLQWRQLGRYWKQPMDRGQAMSVTLL